MYFEPLPPAACAGEEANLANPLQSKAFADPARPVGGLACPLQ